MSINASVSKLPNASPKAVQALVSKIKDRQAKALNSHQMQPTTAMKEIVHQPITSDRAYGLPSRVSTPIFDIIQNRFGNEGEQSSQNRYHQYHDQDQKRMRTKTSVKNTKASLGHHRTLPVLTDTREPFKLSKFKNVNPRVFGTAITTTT